MSKSIVFSQFGKEEKIFIALKVMERFSRGWFGAVYTVFMTSQALELWETTVVNALYMLLNSIIDPFTGNLGDRKGHFRVYLWGAATMMLSAFVYGSAKTMAFFLIAESIGALGTALMSQAMETWLKNRVGDSECKIAKGYAGSIGGIIAFIPQLFNTLVIVAVGLSGPWYLGSLSYFVLVVVGSSLYSNGKLTYSSAEPNEAITVRSALMLVLSSRFLFIPVITGFVGSFSYQTLNMFWGEYIRLNVGVVHLGWYFALINWTTTFASYLSARLAQRFISLWFYGALIGLTAGIVLIVGLVDPIPAVLSLFVLHELPRGLARLVLDNYQNLTHPDNPMNETNRATLLSIISGISTLGAMFGLLFAGILTLFLTIQQTWIVSGVILLALSVIIFFFSYKYERKKLL